jgi:hypothetical protein
MRLDFLYHSWREAKAAPEKFVFFFKLRFGGVVSLLHMGAPQPLQTRPPPPLNY